SVIEPEKDQLPGANRNWLTTNRFVDVSNSSEGISLTSEDAPLIEIGGITANLMGGGYQSADWIKYLPPTQTVESWALNNVWYTNYLAEQSGKLVFRYRLYPHKDFNETEVRERGTDATEPLIVESSSKPATPSLCRIIGNGVVATCLKPADDGSGFILRLWGASSTDHTIELKWRNNADISVWKSNLAEDKMALLSANDIAVPGHGEVTLRIEVKK
ncbi:MAG: glycosyl hydrolase-related protein, partial [Rhabdochlamydiaceae bacterium]